MFSSHLHDHQQKNMNNWISSHLHIPFLICSINGPINFHLNQLSKSLILFSIFSSFYSIMFLAYLVTFIILYLNLIDSHNFTHAANKNLNIFPQKKNFMRDYNKTLPTLTLRIPAYSLILVQVWCNCWHLKQFQFENNWFDLMAIFQLSFKQCNNWFLLLLSTTILKCIWEHSIECLMKERNVNEFFLPERFSTVNCKIAIACQSGNCAM